LRLRTIGGLWIEAESAPSLGPRQLALLALAAAAGKQGVSRDRVVGILWGESADEQARHTLRQTLYNLRRAAGSELISGTTHLRLDPSLPSDIEELRSALGIGNFEAAVGLYTGRFLEGFYLPGAPEFERWVEEERGTLELDVRRALERLAKQADESGSATDSVRWWQRLAAIDPLSARYILGHMRALVAAGDRSGALTCARLHREIVHRELNAEPDAEVQRFERSLRAAPPAPPPESPPPARPSPAPGRGPETPVTPPSTQAATPPPRLQFFGRMWLLSAAVLALALVGVALRGMKNQAAAALPFLAVGEIRTEGSSDSATSGRVLRDLLATSLGGIEGLQVVANSRLVELMPHGPDPAPGAINDAARRAGATEVIEGELNSEAGGFMLSLRRVSAERGVVRRGYIVRAADRPALVDSATAAIARDLKLTSPSFSAAQIRTSSPAAHALYDEGLRAYYGYDGPAAYRLMKAALARDSGFAMAAYYVWHLSLVFNDYAETPRILPIVTRLALRTIERERLLIQASLAQENAATRIEAALAETLTVKYPEDPEGQILLGQVRHKQGDWSGSVAAYERAFRLDSMAGALSGPYCRICRTLALQVGTYLWWDSAAAAERSATRLIALRPQEAGPWNNLIEPLLRLGRRAEAESAWAKQANVAGDWSGHSMHRDLIRWGHHDQVDRELIAELDSRTVHIRADAWWLLMLSLRDQGRLREADTLIHRWRVANTNVLVLEPGPVPTDLALLALDMGRPEVSIRGHRETAAQIATWTNPPAFRARNLIWNLTLAGTAHAAAGDTAVVRRLADSLEVLGPSSYFGGRDERLHYVLRGLLLQREGRHAEAVDAFRRSLYSLTDGYTRTNLMLARSLLALHRGPEAIAVLRPAIHGGVDGSNTYVSRTELHEAMALAFEQVGQRDSAVAHWRAVESAWRHADPQFRKRYLQARLKTGR
jgi:DNA-binding SARP family transcriptional activator